MCIRDSVGTEREVGRKFGRWLDVVVMELLLAAPRSTEHPPAIVREAPGRDA